jgi:phage tail sheath protein FI
MAINYQTPSTYYERVDAGAPPVSTLRTDIPAFVGIARRGPLHAPVPVESWKQFVAYFGDMTGAGYLAYAVRAFFENKGRRCWVLRVSSEAAASASCELMTRPPNPRLVWRISASSLGAWGEQLSISVRATHRAQALADAGVSAAEYVVVNSVSGFERGMQVRVRTAPNNFMSRIVSAVDAAARRIYWINPIRALRLPNEALLTGYNMASPLLIESVEYTLLVREGARVVAVYEGLSPSPSHPGYGPRVLSGIPVWDPSSPNWRLPDAPAPVRIDEQRYEADLAALTPFEPPSEDWLPLRGGWDGLSALTLRDFVGEASDPLADAAESARRRRGLACLWNVDEPTLLAMPDIHVQPEPPPEHQRAPQCIPDSCLPSPSPGLVARPLEPVDDQPPRFSEAEVYAAQLAMVNQCEARRDRVALLDAPYATVRDDRLGIAAIRAWRKRFDSKFASLYFPWLQVADPLRLGGRLTRAVPPSGHVAGFCAKTDWQVGVHKAPANGALEWVQDVTLLLGDTPHGILNEEGVNLIRVYPGRGIRIFGARTVSSDSDWRYLNVRRLLMMIEKSLGVASEWAVFEPNDFRTRAKLHLSFTSFLMALWQRGALAGKTPAEAFFVHCNEGNNPPEARARGELLAEIGVAPAKPFEFVVLRVGRGDNQFEISESAQMEGVF